MKKFFSLLLAFVMVCSLSIAAFAATADEATIDMTRTGNIDLWKYDLTNAEKDGIWDNSYVSTGVRDENGVESILGNIERMSVEFPFPQNIRKRHSLFSQGAHIPYLFPFFRGQFFLRMG